MRTFFKGDDVINVRADIRSFEHLVEASKALKNIYIWYSPILHHCVYIICFSMCLKAYGYFESLRFCLDTLEELLDTSETTDLYISTHAVGHAGAVLHPPLKDVTTHRGYCG